MHGALGGRKDDDKKIREDNENWSDIMQKSDEIKAEKEKKKKKKGSSGRDSARERRLGSGMGEPGDSSWGR